jgi:hypothetical protein
MQATTKNCAEYDHPEFSVNADPNLPEQLNSFLAWLENEVAVGKQFLPDQTVQVGWSMLKIFQREDGTLGLLEPDFKSLPTVFVDSIANTLLHMLQQKSVVESLGLEARLDIPLLTKSAVICNNFGKSTEIFLSRTSSVGFDSGWFLGCFSPSHDHQSGENLGRISLYEAAVRLDERIVPYLGLPSGLEIVIGDSAPRFSFRGKNVPVKPNSYLQKKFDLSTE